MKISSLSNAMLFPLLIVTACSGERQSTPAESANDVEANAEQGNAPIDMNAVELPPMVQRSPAYRCDDGRALYVDVMTDKRALLVRDSRPDTPVRLERDGDEGPFSGGGRTLSGTGSEVRYLSEERPTQTCREADV